MKWGVAKSVYVHFPLCRVRCSYCAFNVTTSNNPAWRNGFAHNVASSYAQLQPASAVPLDTLYFGGGTPSLATPDELQTMLNCFARDSATETTVELNPTLSKNGVTPEELRGMGVTRLSVGLQSLDDGVLKKMLREHTAQTGLAAVEAAAAVFGKERLSVDVIVSVPPAWRSGRPLFKDLERVASMADHVSVYELTVEEGTALGKSVERGETVMPSADRKADEWEEVVETLEQAGVARYEVSNFARRPEARSRHNVAGWRGLSYAGVGPGAHGRLERDGSVYETVQIADPHEWAKKAAAGESTSAVCRRLSAQERSKERVIMSLRSVEGLDAAGRAECAAALEEEGVREVQMLKLISTEGGGLRATNKGLNLLDSVLLRILK